MLWPNMILHIFDPKWYNPDLLQLLTPSFCSGTWADNCWCALPTFLQFLEIHTLHRGADYEWPLLGKRSDLGVKRLSDTRWPHTSWAFDINTARWSCHRRKSEKGRKFPSNVFSFWKQERNWQKITPSANSGSNIEETSINCRCKDLPARIKVSQVSLVSKIRFFFHFLPFPIILCPPELR